MTNELSHTSILAKKLLRTLLSLVRLSIIIIHNVRLYSDSLYYIILDICLLTIALLVSGHAWQRPNLKRNVCDFIIVCTVYCMEINTTDAIDNQVICLNWMNNQAIC